MAPEANGIGRGAEIPVVSNIKTIPAPMRLCWVKALFSTICTRQST
jgi:hypothetical protein